MGFAREVELAPSSQPLTACRDYFGYIPAVYRAQSLLPRLLEAEIGLEAAIVYRKSALSYRQKERLLLVLASAEGNADTATTHYEVLRLLGESEAHLDELLNGYRHCGLPPADVELLGFAIKLGIHPASVSGADINRLTGHGWTAEIVLEAVLIGAWYRFVGCISAGLGTPPDFPPVPISNRRPTTADASDIGPNAGAGPYLPLPELVLDQFSAASSLRDLFGFIPNVFRSQAGCPDVIQAEANLLDTLLSTEAHLSRRQKEQILLRVSASNCNAYFVAIHSEVLAALGVPLETVDRIALEHKRAGLSETDVAILDFALRLAGEPSGFGAEDWIKLRSRGCTDEQIVEAVVMTGLTNFLNTLQLGIGAVPDFEPRIALPVEAPKIANLFVATDRPTEGGKTFDPDAEAVAKVRSGDSDVFEELVTRHSRRVYRTLLGILGSPEEARDAMQDTFLKAYQHLDKFQGRSKFSTWLVSIASNTGLQILRDRKPLQSLDDEKSEADESARPRQVRAWTDDPEQLYSKSETRALVEQNVLKLPAKYRVVLMLRDIEQLSIEETAAALNLGIPALKSRHLRGRLMLREALTPHFAAAKGEPA